jgi:hypothetical protein
VGAVLRARQTATNYPPQARAVSGVCVSDGHVAGVYGMREAASNANFEGGTMKYISICTAALVLVLATVRVILVNAQTASVEDLEHGYQRSGEHILFRGKRIDLEGTHDLDKFAQAVGHPLTLCHDVDASTFVALSEEYTKDKNRVYFKWISPGRFWVIVLADADPHTFSVIDSNLAKDERHVWRHDHVIADADPPLAVVVNPNFVWKDRNRVYYQTQVMAGADPATFRHLNQGYYRDATHVYWCTSVLTDADVESFLKVGDVPYARDRSHVWSADRVLHDVDATTFQLLHNHVFKDAKRVYVSTIAIEVFGADSASFEKVQKLSGHRSAFEPEKHGVIFPSHDGVLFRDAKRYYVFEPDYCEMYTLERKDDVVVISKPVKGSPVRGATVSTELNGDTLSMPIVTPPEIASSMAYKTEDGKLKRYLSLFKAARELMLK